MNDIIKNRLQDYSSATLESQENALKEILQEIILYGLSNSNFFNKALFQGGTALRVLYQLPRFSEDLDFLLKSPDPEFQWKPYLNCIEQALELFSIKSEIAARSRANHAIQRLFLKDSSIGKLLNLDANYFSKKKIMIKLEIDINPPGISVYETKYLDFPMDYSICAQSLSDNFAGKCHALLCRQYLKSRDWFDFSWYISKKIPINLSFLELAINQSGPWHGRHVTIDKKWLVDNLACKIKQINWGKAKSEISRFIDSGYQSSLELWSDLFFLSKLQKIRCL